MQSYYHKIPSYDKFYFMNDGTLSVSTRLWYARYRSAVLCTVKMHSQGGGGGGGGGGHVLTDNTIHAMQLIFLRMDSQWNGD